MSEHENDNLEAATDTTEMTSFVRDLVEIMNNGGIGELDLKSDDVKIRLRTEAVAIAAATPVVSMPAAYAAPAAPTAQGTAPASEATTGAESGAEKVELDGHVVTSPMIGTFYSASAPGEPAYVQVGDEVETGQVIGIIEAMKIMNEITADKSGVVTEILVDNAEAVEYGSPLVRISSTSVLD